MDPLGLKTSTKRVNFTFILADVIIGRTSDDSGNSGLLFSASFGFSASLGINYGETTTNAPTIDDLEGWGTSMGAAVNTSVLLLGAEKNKVSTDLPFRDAYTGDDSGVGIGIGLPFTPQMFTGITGIIMKKKAEFENDKCN